MSDIDEILRKLRHGSNAEIDKDLVQARTALQALVLSKVPEKFTIDPLEGLEQSEEAIGQEWYNQAVEDFTQAINKLFKE